MNTSRTLDLQFVLDGSKALRAGVDKVFGTRAEVQRCRIHKRCNVKDHLPQACRADYDRQLRNAYAMTRYEDAKAALLKIFRQVERINPSAARSLEEGLEETLTLHRLGVSPLLRCSLASTNIIESSLSTVRHVCRNVKRWQGGDHIARWTAAGLREAEKKFRKVKGYRQLKELAAKLNPHSTPQQQVA
ncbi:MAG: transposase [Acidobacteria bacterium]|nr:transposase [Acidobacteriota bacterium]